jgi:hypothetical protein
VERQADGSFKYIPNKEFDPPCTSFDKTELQDYVQHNWSNCDYEGKPTNCHKTFHLFMLAHFVGDIHQPLHVGAIYLDAAGGLVNPDMGRFDENSATAGGNSISEGSKNLHAIPKNLATSASKVVVSQAKAVTRSAGAMESWPAAWASETVVASHSAFQGLSFSTGAHKWSVALDDRRGYVKDENRLKGGQVAKAGARLAELLNAVWP